MEIRSKLARLRVMEGNESKKLFIWIRGTSATIDHSLFTQFTPK